MAEGAYLLKLAHEPFFLKSGNNNRQIYAPQMIATNDIAIYAGRKNRIVHEDDVRPSRPPIHFFLSPKSTSWNRFFLGSRPFSRSVLGF